MRAVDDWHVLLGPLPPDAVPKRQRVASAEVLATSAGAAIAGWEQLVLDLSAGPAGLRIVLVVLDESGRPISASDHVLFRSQAGAVVEMRQESIGGRFEPDGSFRGTRWLVTGPEPADGEEPQWQSVPTPASAEDIESLAAVVAEVLRRQPAKA